MLNDHPTTLFDTMCLCPSLKNTIEWADYSTDGWNVELRQFIRSKSDQQKLKLSSIKCGHLFYETSNVSISHTLRIYSPYFGRFAACNSTVIDFK